MAMERLFYREIAAGEAKQISTLAKQLEESLRKGKADEAELVMDNIEFVIGSVRTILGECERVKGVLRKRGIAEPGIEALVSEEPVTVFQAAFLPTKTNGSQASGVSTFDNNSSVPQKEEKLRFYDLTDNQETVARALFSLIPNSPKLKTNKEIAEEVYASELEQVTDDSTKMSEITRRANNAYQFRLVIAKKLDAISANNYPKGKYPKLEAFIMWVQNQPEFEGVSCEILAKIARGEITRVSELRELKNNIPYELTSPELQYLAARCIGVIKEDGLPYNVKLLTKVLERQQRLYPETYNQSDIMALMQKLIAYMNDKREEVLQANPDQEVQGLLKFVEEYVASSRLPDSTVSIEELLGVLQKR